MAKVKAINIIEKKGENKHSIDKGFFKAGYGLVGDVHAGDSKRQVSLFAAESIEKIKNIENKGFCTVKFSENITTEGIVLYELTVGTKLKIGGVILEVTQIGKECYLGCEVHNLAEKCIMPREVVFAKVLTEGEIVKGDEITLL